MTPERRVLTAASPPLLQHDKLRGRNKGHYASLL